MTPIRNLLDWYEDTLYRIERWRQWHKATGYLHMTRMNTEKLTARRDNAGGFLSTRDEKALTAQILLNQCGMLTYYAQPGVVDVRADGDPIEHRAVILLLVDDENKDWLEEMLAGRDRISYARPLEANNANLYNFHVIELRDPEDPTKYGPVGPEAVAGMPVDRVHRRGDDGGSYYEIVGRQGAQMSAADIHEMFPVRPDAAAQLYRGWQVAVAAAGFGDSDLFDTLIDIATKELEIRSLIGVGRS